MRSYEIRPEPACPGCGVGLSGALGPEQRKPQAGDLSVCAYCSALLVFGEGPSLRLLTDEEREGLDVGLRLWLAEMVAVTRRARAERARTGF